MISLLQWIHTHKKELIKRNGAMEQLHEIIFNASESLRNNQKQLNEDIPVTMEKLKKND